MAIAEFHFSSANSMQQMTSATVIVPEKQNGPFPALYLLHGLSDDHTAWTRRTNIERYVENLPLIVVMPNGERGWYSDALRSPLQKFESFIIQDLIPFIDTTFQTVASKSGRAIAGLSMGGYGAMKLALKHPNLFAAAHSFSGALDMAQSDRLQSDDFKLIFGDTFQPDSDNFALASNIDHALLPQITFDCGRDDFLIEDSRSFDRHLQELNIPHIYTEYPGNHNWPYWNEHILDALPHLIAALGIKTTIDRSAQLNEN